MVMESFRKVRVLVTGGAGFLGSYLCEKLLQQGYDVLCVDNFYTGDKEHIKHLLDHPNFELIRHDITFPLYIEVDQIYNLACPASPIHYQFDPVQTTKTSVHGSINMLGLAKRVKARILQASTSEVYGDPKCHPQQESYWGNVNPIGIRSCYDEGKRCAETLFFDYHRQYNLEIKVARIFNSLTGDQPVIYFKDEIMHLETFAECYNNLKWNISGVKVPCFDSQHQMVLRPISAVLKHKVNKQGFKVRTTWGKSVKITQDHSLFTLGKDGRAKPIFGHQLQVGEYIAVPRKIPVPEIPLKPFLISDKLTQMGLDITLTGEFVLDWVQQNETNIRGWLKDKGISSRQHYNIVNDYQSSGRIPLALSRKFDFPEYRENVSIPSSHICIYNKIVDIDKFLWFLGFYLAEGCVVYRENSHYQLLFCSNIKSLRKLIGVIKQLFGIESRIRDFQPPNKEPTVIIRSRVIVELIVHVFGFGVALSTKKHIPNWVLQLPLHQLVYFLHGFWEGDGNHDAKTTGHKLIFNSSSVSIIKGLNFILSRFGIIGSTSEFETRVSRESEKIFKASRITVQGLDDYNILNLSQATQTLQAKTANDIAWARVVAIEPFQINEDVYDFSVPEVENFVGGMYGICCHNTYGPLMSPNDGRVVSNFIMQALTNEPITVYGEGLQTRSFCYRDDLVNGLILLMNSADDITGPINLGNPSERTVLDLAKMIIEMIGSKSEIVYKPLPQDDPVCRCPDITQAKQLLGWEPEVSIEDGLKQTIAYFESRLQQKSKN